MSESTPARPIWYFPAFVFWNFAERRLRFVWRLLALIGTTLVFSSLIGIIFFPFFGQPHQFVSQLLLNLAFLPAIWLVLRFIDRRRFSETGIFFRKDWWLDLAFGGLLGAVLMAAIFGVELGFGWIRIKDTFVSQDTTPFAIAILLPLIFYASVSLFEELLFRGYLLLNLAEAIKMRVISLRLAVVLAWVLTSLLFGAAHAGNPAATTISTLNISMAGIFIGLAYVLTGSLAIPLGIHLSWNFFQGNVFGFPVSGTNSFGTTVFSIEQSGPLAWTGGAFGPEAGILGLLAMIAGTLTILWWVRWHHGTLAVHTGIAEPPRHFSAS